MLIKSWLTELCQRLSPASTRIWGRKSRRRRRRAHYEPTVAALVEVLETRVLLSAIPVDTETLVNTTISADQTFSDQTDHSFAIRSDGSGLIAWISSGVAAHGKSGQAIIARWLDSQGNPTGQEFQVSAGISPSARNAVVGASATGQFAVVWESVGNSLDKTGKGIFARLYSNDGSPAGSEFRVNQTTVGDQCDASIAWLSPDRFVVTWSGAGTGKSPAIYARVFSSSGTPVTNEIRVPSSSTGLQRDAVVAAMPDGGFLVAWTRAGNTHSPGIFARRFDSTGRPVGNEFQVSKSVPGDQTQPAIAVSQDRGIVIAWQATGSGFDRSGAGLLARRFTLDGTPLCNPFLVNDTTSGNQLDPSVAWLADGGFVVAWSGRGTGDGSGIFVREFDASGSPRVKSQLVNTTVSGTQAFPTVRAQGTGYVVAWSGKGVNDSSGVFLQAYSAPDVNEAPTDISLSNATVTENQPAATAVGTFSTADPDVGNTFTYTLVSGAGSTDNASFTIAGGELRTAASFDFETKYSYSIRVRTSDQGSLSFEKVFTILVTNVNEQPTDIALSNTSVAENIPSGTVVGTFSTTDPDAANTFTYTLVDGIGAVDNAFFSIVGDSLQTAAVFDFETKNSYSVRVRATDQGNLWFEKVFTILVTNVNEQPSDIALSNNTVAENVPARTAVGTFSTTDPDVGNTFTYTLVSGTGSADNNSFTIVGSTLQAAAVFDFEAKNSYSIRVRSTDEGGLSFEKVFTILVSDVTDTDTLTEGDSFEVTLRKTFVVPQQHSVLSFNYSNLFFDTSSQRRARDAFEVALVDEAGNSLVPTIAADRDSFFNLSEGLPVALGSWTTSSGQTVTLDLTQAISDTNATLIFRLVNNDGDTTTTVTIDSFEISPFTGPPVGPVGQPAAALSAVGPAIDFMGLTDVTASFQPVYGRTSFDDGAQVLYNDVAVQNNGQYTVNAPLLVAIDHLSDPTIQVLGADGVTPAGLPYFDFSSLAINGKLLAGQVSGSWTISFHNPGGGQFTYDLVFLGQLNRAPQITSEPEVEGLIGKPYRYDIDATDPNGDTITFSLVTAPLGMTIDSTTGLIAWNPAAGDLGTHSVTVQVDDGQGGVDEQHYVLSVIVAPPNRPPVFSSVPAVHAAVGLAYQYAATASDSDQDPLTFALTVKPDGMSIDASTGIITWSPTSAQLDDNSVAITVSDGRGGVATQEFTICVLPEPANHAPIIISQPVTVISHSSAALYGIDFDDNSTIYRIENFTSTPSTTIVGNTGVAQLADIAIDPLTGDIFAANDTGLYSIDPQTGAATLVGATGLAPGLSSLEITPNHGLIAAHFNDSRLFEINRLTGDAQPQFDTGWLFHGDIAFDPLTGDLLGLAFRPGQSGSSSTLIRINLAQQSVTSLGSTGQHLTGLEVTGAGVILAASADATTLWALNRATGAPIAIGNLTHQAGAGLALIEPSYRYNVRSIDPDNDSLTYSLVEGPPGMTIDDQSGEITWSVPSPDTVPVDPRATYFRVNQDNARNAVAIRLSDFGVRSGDTILLTTTGDVTYLPPNPEDISDLIGVFSASNTLLDGSVHNRVPDAIDAGLDYQTPVTFRGSLPTDIAEDFRIFIDGVVVTVPADAQYLFVSVPDNFFQDNVDVDGDFALKLQLLSTSVHVVVEDGRGGFDTQSFVVNAATAGGEIAGTQFNDLDLDGARSGLATSSPPLVVPGTSDPWLAGMPAGSRASSSDVAPQQSPALMSGLSLVPGATLTFSAFGGVSNAPGGALAGPDGQQFIVHAAGAENGISTANIPINSLVGVFISSTQPNTSAAPAPLIFDTSQSGVVPGGTDYLTLAPELKQVFFIGDGRTSGGVEQRIVIPAGATRLYLGTMDGVQWSNNVGSFTVAVHQSALEPALSGWTIYLDQNRNGRLDSGERSTTTDAEGDYSFENVAPGEYAVAEVVPSGWLQTVPNGGRYIVDVAAGQTTSSIDFGNVEAPPDHQNEAPQFTTSPGDSAVATVGSLFRYDAWAFDPEGDSLLFDLPSRPDGMAVDPETGVVVWTPTAAQLGTQHVVLRVQDGNGGVALQSFDIAVSLPNTAPVVTSSPPGPATVGLPYRYQIQAQDAEGDPLTYRFGTGFTPPEGMALNVQSGLLTWTPAADQAPSQQASVLVDAENGPDTTYQFTIGVTATSQNRLPVIDSAARTTVRVGQTYAYVLEAHDPDGDPLAYSLDLSPPGMTIGVDAQGNPSTQPGLVLWTPSSNDLGRQVPVRVLVSDGRGTPTVQEFAIDVLGIGINAAPTIVSTPPSLATAVGHDYEYRLKADDPDGDLVTWTLVKGPAGMSLDSLSGLLRWSPHDDQLGSHEVVVRVQDAFLASAEQSFTLTVSCVNVPPVIVSRPPTEATQDTAYVYAARVSDAENDPITFSLGTHPDGMTLDENGIIHWTPSASQSGNTFVVSIEARDTAGGVGSQTYNVFVSATPPNKPPIITSAPRTVAPAGGTYEYQVTALDPEGEAITFTLADENMPAGMTIDAGLISWNVPAGLNGPQPKITVIATDAAGKQALQSFAITVRQNNAPTLNAIADQSAVAGTTFRLDVRASDVDGDRLTYAIQGPQGMAIDSFGRIAWQTPLNSPIPSSFPVTITVTDSAGGSASDDFAIAIQADDQAPAVALKIGTGNSQILNNPVRFNVGTTTIFIVTATDNIGVANRTLELVDTAGVRTQVALDASGRADRLMTAPGVYSVVARAVDSSGNASEVSRQLIIVDPSDENPPLVTIISPEQDATVTNFVDIIGTIDDPEDQLVGWDVYVVRSDLIDPANLDFSNPNFKRIGGGTTEVTNSTLATFDPTLLANDGYVIWVVAFDATGQGWAEPLDVSVEGNTKLGQFRQEFTDLQIPVAGIPITITRVYDSRQAADVGDFGYGWTLGLRDGQIRETAAYGAGGILVGDNTFIPDKTKVYLTGPDGTRLGFTYKEQITGVDFFGDVYSRPYFQADPGNYYTLSIDETTVVHGGSFGDLIGGINPDTYTLTAPDGLKYRYNQFSGLQSIADPNGNTLTFQNDGIYVGSRREVTFVRDGAGRITQIAYEVTNDQGQPETRTLTYTYDAKGDLRSFKDQGQLETTFSYKPSPAPAHYLDEIHDPLGRRVIKTEYDDDGRILRIIDADGNDVTYDYSQIANNVETVRDQNGNPTRLTYNDRGNVAQIEVLDVAGNRMSLTLYEYVDSANPDKETKVTQVVDDGQGASREIVTRYEYDARGNTTVISDSIGTRTFQYNDRNSVTQVTDELGRISVFQYDTANNLTTVINAVGDTCRIEYDAQGRPTSYTDFRGNTTTFVYAGDESQPREIHNAGDGSVKRFEYNLFGQVTRSQDEAGVVATYKYDNIGRLIEQRVGNDARVVYEYTGQYKSKQIVKQSEIDSTKPDLVTEYGYYDNGLLKFQVDPEGHITGYRYDANGNQTMLGTWATKADFDQEDISAAADPHLTFAHATFQHKFYYDGANRVDFEVDDYALSLPAASDFDRIKLDYEYDRAGNRTKIIDRNGRVRTFEYDDRGRTIGELWFTDVFDTTADRSFVWVYDTLGNLEQATEYDGAAGAQVLSQYTYTYDTLSRLRTVDNAGTKDMPRVVLTYSYDANGNQVSVTDNLGVSVVSTYDARNRLDTRGWVNTSAQQAVDEVLVNFEYCSCGQISEIDRYTGATEDPSNLVANTIYGQHDAAGRVQHIQTTAGDGTVLSEYNYRFDPVGLVEHADYTNPADSTRNFAVDYFYDKLGQLTDADYSDATTANGIYVDEFYRYDDRGNRIESYLHGTSYVTGPGNRLLSDGTFSYEYDNEGNTTFKRKIGAETTEFTEYRWDNRNRLVEVEIHEPGKVTLVKYTYDMDGRRIGIEVREGVDAPTIITSTTRMVYNGDHVWADFDASSAVTARYLYGDRIDQILARFQRGTGPSDGVAWYLTDRLGSVQELIAETVATVDHHSYSGFGIVLSAVPSIAGSRYAFTARELDYDNGLYYFRARYLDPEAGRFTQKDAIGFIAGDANLYRYVSNNVTNLIDPTGNGILGEYLGTLKLSVIESAALGTALGVSSSLKSYIYCQLVNGKEIDVTDLVIAGLFGGVTGALSGVAAPFTNLSIILGSQAIPALDALQCTTLVIVHQ